MKSHISPPVKKKVLGVDITDASGDKVLEYVFAFLQQTDKTTYIVTPNPEIVMYASGHESYRSVLNNAGISLCDGVGLYKAAAFLGKPVSERISGVDFMEKLCQKSAKKTVTVGFLGGKNNVAERTAECLVKKYPGLKVAFVGDDWPEEASKLQSLKASSKENSGTLELWSSESVDILFVAFGFPKQEEWMAEHIRKLPVRIMMGVGGAFDMLSGDKKRAPAFLRSLGLEWLYRLLQEPWRIQRQVVLPLFMLRVLQERFP